MNRTDLSRRGLVARRLFLILASFVVGLDVYNGAIEPLGMPVWVNVPAALAIAFGAVVTLRSLAFSGLNLNS